MKKIRKNKLRTGKGGRPGGNPNIAELGAMYRFRAGVATNPSGRPKEFREFRDMARNIGAPLAFATLLDNMSSADGSTSNRAAEVMLAYAWGRPPSAGDDKDTLDINGEPMTQEEKMARIRAILRGDDLPPRHEEPKTVEAEIVKTEEDGQ